MCVYRSQVLAKHDDDDEEALEVGRRREGKHSCSNINFHAYLSFNIP